MPTLEEKRLELKRELLKQEMAEQNITEFPAYQQPPVKDESVFQKITGASEAMGQAINQAVLRGYQDEIAGGIDAAIAKIKGEPGAYRELYQKYRDKERARLEQLEEKYPVATGIGAVAGSIVLPSPTGKVDTIGKAAKIGGLLAAEGGLAGLGFSKADITKGEAPQAAAEAGLGAVFNVGLPVAGLAAAKAVKATYKGGKKVLNAMTGVKEDVSKAYLAAPERINMAPEREAIKLDIDTEVAKLKEGFSEARAELQAAKADLSQSYNNAKLELRFAQPDQKLAKELVGGYEAIKARLGQMSEQADEALAQIPGSINKADLLKYIKDVGKDAGDVLVGEKAEAAVKKLKNLYDKIKEGFGPEISHVQLRDIMRQVREDINWNTMASEFNDRANRMRKAVTERVSDVLKEKSPEYKQIMAQMKEMTEALSDMTSDFGSEQKAYATMAKLFDPKGKSLYAEQKLERLSNISGIDYIGALSDLKSAKKILLEAQKGDISYKLVPQQFARYQQAVKNFEQIKDQYGKVSRLTPQNTQSIIKNQGYQNASIENRKALEALESIVGKNFRQPIADRNILDSFAKEATQGSRGVRLYGGLGGGIAGATTSLAGGDFDLQDLATTTGGGIFLGAMMDKYGPKAGKALLDVYIKAKARGEKLPQSTIGKIGKAVASMAQQGNPRAIALNYYLMQNDESYRQYMTSGLKPPEQYGISPRE